MARRLLIIQTALVAAIFLSGCQSANNSNTGSGANANTSPLPPGIQTSPLPPGGTPTPGIPDVNAPKKANQPAGTPTPGIPDLSRPQNKRPGATPTPGIPDLREQQGRENPQANERTTPSRGPISAAQNRNRQP